VPFLAAWRGGVPTLVTTRRLHIQAACRLALWLLLVAPDARAQGVLEVSPLFGTAQVYDSNLFSTSSARQADFITRISPGVESDYRSALLSLLGRYTLDIERFAEHPELTSMDARQRAAIDFRYRPTERLALAADADLLRTQTPGELNQVTSLTFSRASAQRTAAHLSIRDQLDVVTEGTIDYEVTDYRVAGGLGIRTHAATVGANHHLSARDTVSVSYRLQQFFFDPSSTTSHALGLGWTRTITRRASFSIDGGPRVTDGSLAPELSAAVHYHLEPGDLSLAYARTQTTVIGLTGIADAQSLAATAAWRFRRSLQIQVSPAFFRSARAGLVADVYHLTVDVARPIAKRLSLDVTFDGYRQVGNLYAGFANVTIPRYDMTVRLVAAPATQER
jgi:hypothetical protein